MFATLLRYQIIMLGSAYGSDKSFSKTFFASPSLIRRGNISCGIANVSSLREFLRIFVIYDVNRQQRAPCCTCLNVAMPYWPATFQKDSMPAQWVAAVTLLCRRRGSGNTAATSRHAVTGGSAVEGKRGVAAAEENDETAGWRVLSRDGSVAFFRPFLGEMAFFR